jgi:CBS domain-containing protein
MEVRQLMTDNPDCCTTEQTANEAARIMWERDCGVVPVLENGRVCGIVTDRDICMAAYFHGEPLNRISLADIMSRDICCVRPDEDVTEAEHMMQERQVRRLPVVDNGGSLVGMLSLGDVAQTVGRSNGHAGNGHASQSSQSAQKPGNGAACSETDQELLATVAAVSTPRRDTRASA